MATLLIVEDEKPIRISLRAFLREDGHEVMLAEGVEEGLRLLEGSAVDLVITDLIMPRFSGFDLLGIVKERWPHIQVVVFTGEPTIEAAAQALRLGAFDFLSKPITKEDIRKVVDRALRMKEIEDEKRRLERENERYRKELEQLVEEKTRKLRESEERYRTLFENAGVGIGYYSPEGRAIAFNKLAAWFLGDKAEEALGKTPAEIFGPEAGGVFLERLLKASKSETGQDYLDHLPFPDGEKWFLSNYNRITDEAGTVIGVLAVSQDLSKQKNAERELKQLNATLTNVIEHTSEFILISDSQGKPVLFNTAYANIMKETLGLDMKPGIQPHTLLPDSETKAWWDSLHQRVLSGEDFREEFSFPMKDGGLRHFEIHYYPIIEDGEVTGFTEFTRDITERKETEEKLRKGELIFRRFFENIPHPTAICADLDGPAMVNGALASYLGYSEEELESRPVLETLEMITHPEDWEAETALFRQMLSGELTTASARKRYIHKDGRTLDAELTTKVFKDESGDFLFAMSVVTPLDGDQEGH